jgi:L-rhamnose mutarotase
MKKPDSQGVVRVFVVVLTVLLGAARAHAAEPKQAEEVKPPELKRSVMKLLELPKPAFEAAEETKEAAPRSGKKRAKAGSRGRPTDKEKAHRIATVIELRPEKKDYYIELHAKAWPSVLKRVRESNIRNYSIYLAELGGKLYLFSYFEYVGDDIEADMARMAQDPETQRWWKETDPCQKRLPGTPDGQQWLEIPEVFHTD